MKFRIITTNCIGRDIIECKNKEEFLNKLSAMIDVEDVFNKRTYFDAYVYSDAGFNGISGITNIAETDDKSIMSISTLCTIKED